MGTITQEVTGPAPDYVTRLGEAPAAAVNGEEFAIATTVENAGDAGAVVESTTRYFLSADRVLGEDDRSMTQTATVPPLGVGEESAQDIGLSVPADIPSGSYFVIACADRRAVIPELDDRNNCAATAAPVAVTGPDLQATAVTDPPAVLQLDERFPITQTIRNAGAAPAGPSLIGHYLSPVPGRGPGARRISAAPQAAIGPLAPGEETTRSIVVRAPAMPLGSYYLVSCADLSSQVAESEEDNNCTASAGTTTTGPADLVVSSVGDFPAIVAAGASFFAADVTANQGFAPAPAFTNQFALSVDEVPGDDIPLGSRVVPAVPAQGSGRGWAELTVDPTTPPGDYVVIVCADPEAVVEESSETNNCQASTSRLTVPEPEDTTCGDGQIQSPEQCDDGNAIDDDGCDRDCVPSAVAQVAAGLEHSCARLRSGSVRCWGSGALGQLGYGNTRTIGDDEFPFVAGNVDVGGVVVELTAGDSHTCALLDYGAVRCWGEVSFGKLGYGPRVTANVGDNETPASVGSVPVGGPVLQIEAGRRHTCARMVGGGLRCWGIGNAGRLGRGNERPIGILDTPESTGDIDVGGPVVEVAAGYSHTCARLEGGRVRCWGRGKEGQLGYGNRSNVGDRLLPSSAGDVVLGGPAIQLTAGFHFTCALLAGGSVRCWGDGEFGRLGYGSEQSFGDDETPASAGDVDIGGPVAEIASGHSHTCARLVAGGVRCWGRGEYGALGHGDRRRIGDNETPASAGDAQLEGRRVIDLDAGAYHNCALFSAGRVRCWGEGTSGKLGYRNTLTIGDDEVPASAGSVRILR